MVDARFCPKVGNTAQEYEDAFWPRRLLQCETTSFRCAVADGATETSFSGRWATLLVSGWCKSRTSDVWWNAHLPKLQSRWRAEVDRMTLPWYADEKARLGAFSSLLGVHLYASSPHRDQGEWRATAVGDSCVFQMRAGSILSAFPLDSCTSFDNHPFLIPSRGRAAREEMHAASLAETWRSGDHFYLMTDAAAQWFLSAEENGKAGFDRVEQAFGIHQDDFCGWARAVRAEGGMRNDDVTILRLLIA